MSRHILPVSDHSRCQSFLITFTVGGPAHFRYTLPHRYTVRLGNPKLLYHLGLNQASYWLLS